MMDDKWSPWIKFNDSSASFTLGFEAGMVYSQMLTGDKIDMLLHAENEEQIRGIASKLGYVVGFKPLQDEWVQLVGEKCLKRIK